MFVLIDLYEKLFSYKITFANTVLPLHIQEFTKVIRVFNRKKTNNANA